jgi:hypothetical protein
MTPLYSTKTESSCHDFLRSYEIASFASAVLAQLDTSSLENPVPYDIIPQ